MEKIKAAFCLCDTYLTIINVNNPVDMRLLGQVDTGSILNNLIKIGNYVYIAANSRVYTVDVKYLTAPRIVGSIDSSSGASLSVASGICYNDEYIFVTDSGVSTGTVNVFEYSDPENITFVTKETGSGGPSNELYSLRRIAIRGNFLYTCGMGWPDYRATLNVLSITGLPGSLSVVRDNFNTFGAHMEIDPDDDYLYSSVDASVRSTEITTAPDTTISDNLSGYTGAVSNIKSKRSNTKYCCC